MKKNDHRDYRVVLSRLSEDDGGGWLAEVPELTGCMSDGETQEEALANVQEAVRDWISAAKEKGARVPRPALFEEASFSGKFTLRLPKSLHRHLSERAEAEGVSLNQLILAMVGYSAGATAAPVPAWEQQPEREVLGLIPGTWMVRERVEQEDLRLQRGREWPRLLASGRVN